MGRRNSKVQNTLGRSRKLPLRKDLEEVKDGGDGDGKNQLGKTLMSVRRALRKKMKNVRRSKICN
jgi:predicted NAD-dependent protein-ADP-ribosyltransferase YbiA (DUF1768 family)